MRKTILIIITSLLIVGSLRLYFFGTSSEPGKYSQSAPQTSQTKTLQPITSEQTSSYSGKQQAATTTEKSCDSEELAAVINAIFYQRDTKKATCLSTLVTEERLDSLGQEAQYRLLLILYPKGQWKLLTASITPEQLYDLISNFISQPETLDFFKNNNINPNGFVGDVLSQVNSQTLLSLLDESQNISINQLAIDALLARDPMISLQEIWSVAIKANWGDNKDATLEKLIKQYLADDSEATITYLHDHYLFEEQTVLVRGYDFAKALGTLYAWQNNELASMSPQHYETDSSLVIDYVGNLLSHDIQQFSNQLNDLSDNLLLPKVIASTMQSEQFFRLSDDDLITLLGQLPQDISQALAQAYNLQLQYSEDKNKAARQQLLRMYL